MTWHENKIVDDPRDRSAWADYFAMSTPFSRGGYAMLPLAAVAGEAERFTSGVATFGLAEGCVTHFALDLILRSTKLRAIVYSPAALMHAAAHLGMVPKVADVSVWRTFPGDPHGAQTWHRDRDDWRACKLFCYLTDVTEANGPHEFATGSQRIDRLSLLAHDHPPEHYFKGNGRDIADDVDRLPRKTFTGPTGTCWIEQTYGFHRGLKVQAGERIMFQACYTQTIYPHMQDKAQAISRAWGEP